MSACYVRWRQPFIINSAIFKNQACSYFSLQMTVFYRFLSHCFWPTKVPHFDVIVPYFVYCEERSWRKQRVHALHHQACYINKSSKVRFSNYCRRFSGNRFFKVIFILFFLLNVLGKHLRTVRTSHAPDTQFRTQSLLAFWSAGQRCTQKTLLLFKE